MSKSKDTAFAIGAKTLKDFDKRIAELEKLAGGHDRSIKEIYEHTPERKDIEPLEERLARLENSLKSPERPSQLISDEELQDIHSKLQAEHEALNAMAHRIEVLETPVLPSVTLVDDDGPIEATAVDFAAMRAATREALRKEITAIVEQRLAAGFLEATSAQISNIKSELRELARDIAKDAIAEDKHSSSRRGRRPAVTPA